jgi:LuxR family maltose regulon positive regulatory protein
LKKQKTLKRERVNRALESIFGYPLTVVEAPIGFGKTTALREFLSARRGPVLWLGFLTAEDSASFFWNSLAAEIGRLDQETGSRLKSLGFPADAPQTAIILSILNDFDFPKNTVLVIDDFHLAEDPRISALLAHIVKEPPENFQIAIITRDTSNLDISELLAKGLCNVLSQQTLRFTDGEIRDYCAMMGHKPNDAELKKISEYTGGWISMVYLTLLGIGQGIPVGKSDAIDELVEKTLYNACGEQVRRFLLRLSAMDSFTAEQAQFVTEEPQAEEYLKKLRNENAFIDYDKAAGVYKIHNVLLDFLRLRHKNDPERLLLCRRVGEWLLSHGSKVPAYGYFTRAGDSGRVLELLNDTSNITYGSTYFEGFFGLFASIPRETLFQYPFAYLQYISMLIITGSPDGARDGVTRLYELQEVYGGMEGLDPRYKNRVLAEAALTRLFSVFNDIRPMVDCIREALRLLDGESSCLITQESEFTFASPHLLYTYYKEPGKLKETADFTAAEFPSYARACRGCGTGCDYLAMAEYALETGDWQGVELNAFKAIYKARTQNQISIIICANLTLIRLYIYQGKTDEALDLLHQLRADVALGNNVYLNTATELVNGYVYACLGRYDSIPAWLQTGDMSPAQFMYQGVAFNYIVYGKAVLLSKNYIKLEVLTEEFRHYFSVFHNQLGLLHNQVFAAAAKHRLYGMDAGCEALASAIAMGREDHIILPFAEYAPAIMDMMRSIQHSDSRDMYIKAIYDACEQYMASLKHTTRSAVSLSGREIEILVLTAEGLKRDEIALRLNLAPGTVKNHLENIYRKLEASGRTAAIKKAREMKLL